MNSVLRKGYTIPGDFNGNWINTGPKTLNQASGVVNDLLVDDINNFWVGVHDGGLWKVTNNVWNCITDNILPAGAGVTSIVRSPFDPDEMYFGTFVTGYFERDLVNPWPYGHGMWRSGDGGLNWSLVTSGPLNDFSKIRHITYCPNLLNNAGSDVMMLAIEANPVSGTAGGNKLLQKIGNGAWADVTPPNGLNFNTLLNATRIVFPYDIPGVFFVATDAHDIFEAYIYRFEYNVSNGLITSYTKVANINTLHDFNTPTGSVVTHAYRYDIAYAGSGLLYVGAAGQNLFEGCWNLVAFNVNTNSFTTNTATNPLLRMPLPLEPGQNRSFLNMTVHPNSPNVIYFGGIRPFYVRYNGTVWERVAMPYATANVFHDDVRCVKILTSVNTPANLGSQDIVFWGNDGGVSVTNGSTCVNRNAENFITQTMYDVDVTELGRKRAGAAMHNRMFNSTNNPNVWQNQDQGDGFNTIYDKRNIGPNHDLYYHNGSLDWNGYTHTATIANSSATAFPTPTTGGWERRRSFKFPHAFDGDRMFLANKNLHMSQPGGYQPWINASNTGHLFGTWNVKYDHCRAIAFAPTNPDRRYFVFRFFPNSEADIPNYWDKKLYWKRPSDGTWRNITDQLPPIYNNVTRVTDVVVDDKNEYRIFVSIGSVNWGNPGAGRVYWMEYDPVPGTWSWGDMSQGLTELPVVRLVYQHGSDDIIYAGTDAGVYRWDGPLGCWVRFDDLATSPGKMPGLLVHDLEIDYCAGKLVMGSYGRGIWETDLYQFNHFPGPSIKIVSNETWGSTTPAIITNKIVKGSIVVTSGNKLTIVGTTNTGNLNATSSNTTIYMPKWGQIIVEKNAMLEVIGAHITNGCDATWYGIQTHGSPVPQTYNPATGLDYNHGVVILRNAIIEHAEEAVVNAGGPAWPNAGGKLDSYNSHFINNRRSFAFYKYFNYAGINLAPDHSIIKYNRFDVDDNIRIGFYANISMWGVRGVLITHNQFYNNQTLSAQNPSRQTCVLGLDAGYVLDKNEMSNFQTGIQSSLFGYSGGNLHPVVIMGNTLDGNEIGISLDNLTRPGIVQNTINIGQKQTYGLVDYYSLGSKLNHVSMFEYRRNHHHRPYQAPSPGIFQYTAGTEVYNTGAQAELIYDNDYHDLLIGNDGSYQCGNPGNGIPGIVYRCNTNENNSRYDFVFQGPATIGKFQVGPSNQGAGNTFSNTPGVSHWTHFAGIGSNAPVEYFFSTGQQPTQNILNVLTTQAQPNSCTPQNFNLASLDTCGYQTISDGQMTSLKSQYLTTDSTYQLFNTLYLQLMDNGSTPALVEEISNASIEEQLTTRADFLSISPYVSQRALRELGMAQVVSNPIYLEILLANPDATKQEGFIDFLTGGLPNPLPAYMIALVKASWVNPATARNVLERKITEDLSNMNALKSHIIKAYAMSENVRSDDSVFSWMLKDPSLKNRYEVIEHLLYHGQISTADSFLANLPMAFSMTAFDSTEYAAFIDLYTFKKNLLTDSLEVNQLDSARLNVLQQIADAPEYTFARSMARNALCFFYQICYPDTSRQLPQIAGRLASEAPAASVAPGVIVFPNPAQEFVVFYYDFSEDGNSAISLAISDLMGKVIYRSELSGRQGQRIWATGQVPNGTYLYLVSTQTGQKYNGKITVQR